MRTRILLAVFLAAATAMAQPAFEVASVKRAEPGKPFEKRGGPGTDEPGRITYTGVVLRPILGTAYGMPVMGPDWLDTERYDILATVPAGTSKEDAKLMMQGLLKQQFGVTLHRESKDFPSYDLVVAKNGPKLKIWMEAPGSPALPPLTPMEMAGLPRDKNGFPQLSGRSGMAYAFTRAGRAHLEALQQDVAGLATWLGSRLGAPVVDKTQLTGKYNFTLEFELAGDLTPEASANADPERGGDIFTAVQQQLGLKLEPKKTPHDVLIIDHIEKTPAGN